MFDNLEKTHKKLPSEVLYWIMEKKKKDKPHNYTSISKICTRKYRLMLEDMNKRFKIFLLQLVYFKAFPLCRDPR